MKKKQFKFKGVVLACCLAASMPLGITTPLSGIYNKGYVDK